MFHLFKYCVFGGKVNRSLFFLLITLVGAGDKPADDRTSVDWYMRQRQEENILPLITRDSLRCIHSAFH
jgi:hypothetical protein